MNCPHCQTENPAGARFCFHCGAALASRCTNCETELHAGARFCMNCGQPVGASTPADDARLTRLAAATPVPLAQKVQDAAHLAGERRTVTALFMDAPDCHAWRYRYWSTVTECFADAYAARIGRWCAGHGLAFTGHFYAEESLHGQLAHVGAVMPHYAHQQVPGIDQLCHQVMASSQVKQASSVAHQFGRRVMSEAFGCTGWETSPEE